MSKIKYFELTRENFFSINIIILPIIIIADIAFMIYQVLFKQNDEVNNE